MEWRGLDERGENSVRTERAAVGGTMWFVKELAYPAQERGCILCAEQGLGVPKKDKARSDRCHGCSVLRMAMFSRSP